MLLNNLRLNNGKPVHIETEGKLIRSVTAGQLSAPQNSSIDFNGAMVMPGIINSHDHLDFNLYPQLGSRYFRNYTQWGRYIHKHYKKEIDQVLNVPLALRTEWGLYKNLLGGVTTVVNHGEKLAHENDLISVIQNYHCLHSVHFEKLWKLKLNAPFKSRLPYVVHTGEGIDRLASEETDELLKWNILNKKLIGIHGVAMQPDQAAGFKALVWCPESNYFMFNKTADIKCLKKYTSILFGTDSTLTSHWNIWEHLRMAIQTRQLNADELLESITTTPARIWQLNSGMLAEGRDADLLITKPVKDFYKNSPRDILLVMHRGEIKFFDASLYERLKMNLAVNQYSKIALGGDNKFIKGNLIELMQRIKYYYPQAQFPVAAT